MPKKFDDLKQRVRREINARKHSPLESIDAVASGVAGPRSMRKFTERARKTLWVAQDEAMELRHNYIGTEHLLLGLIHEHDAVAGRVLLRLGVNLEAARAAVAQIVGRGEHDVTPPLGMTPRAKKVMELAADEARELAHHYVGAEHVLLGLIREGGGIGAGVLESFGLRLGQVREAVIEEIESLGGRAPTHIGPLPTGPKNNVVTCRLDDRAVAAMDALVEAGIRSTRSDAAAWLIAAGIEAHRPLFDRVEATINEIRRLRAEAQLIAQQVTAEATAMGQAPAAEQGAPGRALGSDAAPPDAAPPDTDATQEPGTPSEPPA